MAGGRGDEMAKVTSYIKAYSASGLNVAQNASVESGWIKNRFGTIGAIGLDVTGTNAAVEVRYKTRTAAGIETEYLSAANVLATTAGHANWPTGTAYNEAPLVAALRPGLEYKFQFKNLSASAMTALEARLIRETEV